MLGVGERLPEDNRGSHEGCEEDCGEPSGSAMEIFSFVLTVMIVELHLDNPLPHWMQLEVA